MVNDWRDAVLGGLVIAVVLLVWAVNKLEKRIDRLQYGPEDRTDNRDR